MLINNIMNKEYFLPVSILIAAVLVAGAVIYSAGVSAPAGDGVGDEPVVEKSEILNLTASDVVLGNLDAPVTIIEYSDFQCPFCGRFFSQTVNRVKQEYIKTGKVKFVYRHFAFLGDESKAAASAVECAKDQGKFWDMHDAVFGSEINDGQEHNGNLKRSLFMTLAEGIGLDTEQYGSCLDDEKYVGKVERDYASAQVIGVRATPTIFVNGEKVEGALPFEQFKVLIEKYLTE
mgnify:CR=1 FL=1